MSDVQQQRVVIIGGGYAATETIVKLQKAIPTAQLTLIEPKSHTFLAVGAPRALVDAQFAEKCFVPYSSFFKGNHIQKYCEEVDMVKKQVWLVDGTDGPIDYDVLIVASGRSYARPFRFNGARTTDSNDRAEMLTSSDEFHPQVYSTTQLLQQLDEQRSTLAKSSKVVIVGGGATGIETAAEVKLAFPEKNVVIYQSKPRLLTGQREVSDKLAATILQKLRAKGVQVELNTRFEEQMAGESDFVVRADGGQPNTSFLPDTWTTPEGFVKVDSNLNVVGQKHVFAMGDIVFGSDPNIKSATLLHAPVCAHNVVRVLKLDPKLKKAGQLPGPLAKFFIVTLGDEAVGAGMFGRLFAAQKAKDFFLERRLKALGVQVAK